MGRRTIGQDLGAIRGSTPRGWMALRQSRRCARLSPVSARLVSERAHVPSTLLSQHTSDSAPRARATPLSRVAPGAVASMR